MKKFLFILLLIISLTTMARAQQGLLSNTFTSVASGGAINLRNTAIVNHQITWTVQGTVSSCTVALDSSADGVSWNAGGVITGQTCTSNGQSSITSGNVNFVRINMTTFTGTGNVVVTWTGTTAQGAGGSSFGTPPISTRTLIACYPPGGPNGYCNPGVSVQAQQTASFNFNTLSSQAAGQIVPTCAAGAITATIPDGGGTNFSFGYQTSIWNGVTTSCAGPNGTVTLQNTSASTINGGTSLAIPFPSQALIYLDSQNNWLVTVIPVNATLSNCATTNALGIFTASTTLGCGNGDFTYATHTLTGAAAGFIDLSAMSGANALKIPVSTTAPTQNGGLILNSTFNALELFNSVPNWMAVAGLSGSLVTTCINQVITAVSSTAAPTCSSPLIKNSPGTLIVTAADVTCGTGGTIASCTSATTITGMSITLPSATLNWSFDCHGVVSQATGVVANQWLIQTATNGATNVTASYDMGTAVTASAYGAVTDQASTTTAFQITPSWTLGATGTKMPFHIWGTVEGASSSGTTLNIQVINSNNSDLLTIYRGMSCHVF